MLVIEGPDGAGKTTLIRRLSADLKISIAPRVVGSDTKPLVDLAQWVEDNTAKGFQRTLFDRHRLISESIYGPATRAKQDPKFSDLGWLQEQMNLFYSCRPLIVYCMPPIEFVRENVIKSGSDNPEAVVNRTSAIYAGYASRWALDSTRERLAVKLYNYRTTRYEEVLGWFKLHLRNRPIGGFQDDHDDLAAYRAGHLTGSAGV